VKKVLVTGASGFIGRNSLDLLLARGFEVHAVCRHEGVTLPSGVVRHIADLLQPAQLDPLLRSAQPTHLLHLAWYAEPATYRHAPENFRWVGASMELLQAFRSAGGQRAVLAGTCAEYDWSQGHCLERRTPTRPQSVYATCKHALHLLAESYAATTGLSLAWARMFYLFGPGEHASRLVPSVIRSLLQDGEALCSDPAKQRDFLHVEDAAAAFVALLDSAVDGAVNIASGRPVTLQALADEIIGLTGGAGRVRFGAMPAAEGDPLTLTADVSRLRDEVGWRPRYNLRSGLEQTIGWWRARAGGAP
jgi:nucleoside-diphosphate-sugar epimerase